MYSTKIALYSKSTLLDNAAAFPNLAKLAAVLIVLPITIAIVERTYIQQCEADKDKASYVAEWVRVHWSMLCAFVLKAQINSPMKLLRQ